MSRKKLREPTAAQRSSGLPTSKQEAIKLGITRFIPSDGRERIIRQYGSRKFPNGSIELASTRAANRGTTRRNQATITTSEQQFVDFGKRNGYTVEQSKETYKRFLERNRAQVGSVPPGMHNDHFLPHKSDFYQAGENYRTKLILSPKVNGYKTDKMPTPAELRGLGMPTSQTELIRQEFADLPAPNVKKARALASKIASDPSRERARDANTRFKEAQQRRAALNGDLHIHSHHMTTPHLRNAAKGLAIGGVAALGPLGTAASASETAIRSQIAKQTGNPLDQFQALLSGFSLAADAASYAPPATIPATIASTAADVVNGGIDTGRDIYKTLLGK